MTFDPPGSIKALRKGEFGKTEFVTRPTMTEYTQAQPAAQEPPLDPTTSKAILKGERKLEKWQEK